VLSDVLTMLLKSARNIEGLNEKNALWCVSISLLQTSIVASGCFAECTEC
jgi:hypothetical protein